MNSILFQACKELIDDAKAGCADLVFKEVCLEILARAKHVLNNEDFKALIEYTSELMQKKVVISVDM